MPATDLYKFFLCNPAGQCYYVRRDGGAYIVDLTAFNNWYAALPNAPEGWQGIEIGFDRNMTYWGLNRSFSTQMRFTGDGATIIRYLMYTQQGTETPLFLVVCKWNDLTGQYDLYYNNAEIDLSRATDDVVNGVTVNVIEGGLQKIIKAYENTTFEIPLDGSIPQNILVNVSGLMFNCIQDYGAVPFQMTGTRVSGCTIPMAYLSQQGDNTGTVQNDQPFHGFDRTDNTAFGLVISDPSKSTMVNVGGFKNMTVSGTVTFTGGVTNGCLVVWTSAGNFYPLINTCDASRNPTGALAGTHVIPPTTIGQPDGSGNYLVAPGEYLYVMLISSDGTINLGIEIGDIEFAFNSQFPDSTTVCIRPLDCLNILLQKICQQAFPPPFQRTYVAQSALLTAYSHLVLTSGQALRQIAGAKLKISLGAFYKTFDAKLCAAMGPLGSTTDPNGEVLFFESINKVLDPTTVTMEVGSVAQVKISPAVDLLCDAAFFGQNEQKYDEKQGNSEWNTKVEWKLPMQRVKKTYEKLSPARWDAYGIDYTRWLVTTSNTANNAGDNDVFGINVDFSLVQSAQAVANGVLGTYYGSGHLLPDATQGINRGQAMAFSSITGSGIASVLSLTQSYGPADTLTYNGSGDTVTMAVSVRAEFIASEAIHYYFTGTGPFLKHHKEILLPGATWPITFKLWKAGSAAPLYEESHVVVGGQSPVFTFSKTFTSLQLGFGDSFYVDIEYDEGNTDDGHLLPFNIISYSITMSDNNPTPVYEVLKTNYSASTNPNPSYLYNVEDVRPLDCLMEHAPMLASMLYFQQAQSLIFQTLSKNLPLSTTIGTGASAVTKDEHANIPVVNLGPPLFYPFYIELMTRVPLTAKQVMQGAINGHILALVNGTIPVYFFPMSVKIRPSLEDAQVWKGLISIATDLTQLLDLNYTGLEALPI